LAYTRFEAGFAAEALAHAEAALALAGADSLHRSRALVRRAWVELAAGRSGDDADAHAQRLQGWLQEALALARAAADPQAQARALHQLAVVASHLHDDWVGAEALLARSQALWQTLGDRRKAQARLRNRAQCWLRQGRMEEARRCFEQCARAAQDDGDWVGQIDSLLSLSSLLSLQRQWQAALDIDRRCVALCWQRWHRHGLAYALWNPPRALARLRRPAVAMRLMAFAATNWEANFGPLARADRLTVKRVRGLVRAQLGPDRADALWAEGAALSITQAVDLALQA
jgi:tetratricopeptide (TPR) repeat protein